jgi:hypothetical protein
LLQRCVSRGNGSSGDCLKAIKDCAAKGTADEGCVTSVRGEQSKLMASCSALELGAGTCGKAVEACIAKGTATPECVNDKAIGSEIASPNFDIAPSGVTPLVDKRI